MLCVFCLWCQVSTQPRSASESNVHGAFGGLPIPQGQVPPGEAASCQHKSAPHALTFPSSSKAQSLTALRGGETQCSRGRSLQEPTDGLLGGTAPPMFLPGLCFSTQNPFQDRTLFPPLREFVGQARHLRQEPQVTGSLPP